MPRQKRPSKTLRTAMTYKSRKSFYAPSADGSTSSLGQRLVVRRLDQSKGKGRADSGDLEEDEEDELDDDDEVREGIKREYRDRAEKAWQTRRESGLRRDEARAERLVAADNASNLPSDDLLNALHYHTSKFYTTHSLLLEPYQQSRARQWGSKKRMYLQTEGVAPIEKEHMDKDTWAHLVPIKRRRVMSVPVWAARDNEDQEGDNDADEEEREDEVDDEDEEQEEEEPQEEDERGESADEDEDEDVGGRDENDDEEQSQDSGLEVIAEEGEGEEDDVAAQDAGGVTESPKKGKIVGVRYKRRDMFKSLDGTAMLALGFLVEKFIASELRKAGYRPPVLEAASEVDAPANERDDPDE